MPQEPLKDFIPFTSNVLRTATSTRVLDAQAPSGARSLDDDLPASYCLDKLHFRVPRPDRELFSQELNLERLHCIMNWLWLCGQTVPPRPLHHQLRMDRSIVITEHLDLHVVWGNGHVYLKPLPRWLLSRDFWEGDYEEADLALPPTPNGSIRTLRSAALGFLLSYVALIQHESDFHIAKDAKLIPKELTWVNWKLLVREIITGPGGPHLRSKVADRFIYGELRLQRLNIIYLFLGLSVNGYIPRWDSYRGFIQNNLDIVVAGTVYLALVLGAMQLGLATTLLENNNTFQSVSYGMTVLAILGPLVAVVLVILLSVLDFFRNWSWNRRNEKKTARILGRTWR